MGRLFVIVVIVGLVAGLMLPADLELKSGETSAPAMPTRVVETPAASQATSAISPVIGPATVLERAADGHFYAEAQVNGMAVRFVVDTGASGVALSAADAQRAGLQFSSAEYSVIGSGASGPVSGKRVTLDRVTLGGKTVEGVDGAILADSPMSLLGQSFLSRMGRIEIAGDRMIIR